MADTVGDRMKAIRIAIGGSLRNEISQEALGELLGWDKWKVSRLERGAQPLSRDDAIALAKVDPQQRGPGWVMFGDENEGDQNAKRPNGSPTVSPPVWKEVEYLDPSEPTQPSRAKGKAPKRKPDRSARAS